MARETKWSPVVKAYAFEDAVAVEQAVVEHRYPRLRARHQGSVDPTNRFWRFRGQLGRCNAVLADVVHRIFLSVRRSGWRWFHRRPQTECAHRVDTESSSSPS